MPYIGNTPADKFLTLAKQSFSTSATTSYTLDSAVSSTQDIALFINNVRQSPVDAYTVSGTALTLTSATAGTDEMYCVYLGKTVGTVSPASNSVTNDMLTGSIANSKLANSSITLNGSAVSLGGSASLGITNAEQWGLDANQAIASANTDTLLSGFSRRTNNGTTNIGTIVSESSGTFSFSATGKYLITYFSYMFRTNHLIQYAGSKIKMTTNDSTYNDLTVQFSNLQDTASAHCGTVNQSLVDISDTSNCKIRLFIQVSDASGVTAEGSATKSFNYVNFIRIGDT